MSVGRMWMSGSVVPKLHHLQKLHATLSPSGNSGIISVSFHFTSDDTKLFGEASRAYYNILGTWPMKMDATFQPPSEPPPLLSKEEIDFLCFQGWLPLHLTPLFSSRLDSVTAEAAKFFENDHDRKIELYPPRNGTECGYYVVPNEKEYVTFRHQLHNDSSLESHVQIAWQQSASFLYRVLYDLSKSRGIDVSVWDSMVDGSLELPSTDNDLDNIISLMRVFQYFPEGVADQHTDVGLLTLCIGGGAGLEVVDHSCEPKRWRRVEWPVIMIGQVVSSLLNGSAKPCMHRVVKNPEGRSSIVFALRPRLRGQIDLSQFGGEGVVDAREHFYKIKADRYNINATREFREKQRKAKEAKQSKA